MSGNLSGKVTPTFVERIRGAVYGAYGLGRIDGQRVGSCAYKFAVFMVKAFDDEMTFAIKDRVCELQVCDFVDERSICQWVGQELTTRESMSARRGLTQEI